MSSSKYLRVLKKICKKLVFQDHNSLYRKSEFKALIERMDHGDFTFTPAEEKKMIQQWIHCVSKCPLPTKIYSIYYENSDALTMNSLEVAETGFMLPYGIAFEETNRKEYQDLINFALHNGIDFKEKVVLDAGCGFGGLLTCVNQMFPSSTCIGIECVPSAKELLKKRCPWAQVQVCNLEAHLEIFQKQFLHPIDVIFCTAVLEHLQRPEIALRNLLSILVKGGRPDSCSA